MRVVDIINKKKMGQVLSQEEIEFFVQGYVKGEIPDYQIAALYMAIYFQGMMDEEITNLTMAYVNSGEIIDLSGIQGVKVDKHSTGGVGDKISLIVIPLVASLGIPVAKMSGRGLGHTGGTIDKLEAIPGFKTTLNTEEFISNVNKHGMAVVGQTANLTPADKLTYALRDVTGTVDSIPLIASSIMSKKIASGADAIVLDVKVGSGAFMKSIDEAKKLAGCMVQIGKSLNRRTIAIITDMNQPLGHEVGNANEIREVIDVLSGKGAEDETTVALTIATYMAIASGKYADFNSTYGELQQIIASGRAIEKLKELITIQGGNPQTVEEPAILPQAKHHLEIRADQAGYISHIDAEQIGIVAMLLGAGREKKEDPIDYAAGVTLLKKVGDYVKLNEPLCLLHTNLDQVKTNVLKAYKIQDNKPDLVEYIHEVIK
ncbi:pyrimidine-nucleoside phosphorylase [Desulfitobacterium sp. THU1]|uniref:pyrimidine-nucleoside phosphorylase n=1 Tax=Desulfitobacterium sp. THU1 TaxID=3138072 RepID=UPI00311F492F